MMLSDKPQQAQFWLPPGDSWGQLIQLTVSFGATLTLLTVFPSLNGPVLAPIFFGLLTLQLVLGAPRVIVADDSVHFRLNGYWTKGRTFRTVDIDGVEFDGSCIRVFALGESYEFGPFPIAVRLFFTRRVERILRLIRERAALPDPPGGDTGSGPSRKPDTTGQS